jgi:hypothetical protein
MQGALQRDDHTVCAKRFEDPPAISPGGEDAISGDPGQALSQHADLDLINDQHAFRANTFDVVQLDELQARHWRPTWFLIGHQHRLALPVLHTHALEDGARGTSLVLVAAHHLVILIIAAG